MGNFGMTEIILILLVLVLVLGGRKIPELMKGIGKGVQELKKTSPIDAQPTNMQPGASRYKEVPYSYFLEASLKGRDLLLQDSSIRNKRGTNFEALLFTSAYIMRRIKLVKPNLWKEFEKGFIDELYNYTIKQNIADNIPDGFSYFFAQRFKTNSQEIDLLHNTQEKGIIPLQRVAYNIYDNPLSKDGTNGLNLIAAIELTVKISHVFDFLDRSVSIIVQEYKL